MDAIRFFDESVTDAQMKEQLTRYGLYDLIAAMAAKGEILKREDARLTAGQRRLISLARILVRNPKVILFDEVTAGVDSYTETLVLRVIRQAAKEHTCLMISHKESDLRIADKVIRL